MVFRVSADLGAPSIGSLHYHHVLVGFGRVATLCRHALEGLRH